MRVPVESSAVRVDGAKNADIQRPFDGGPLGGRAR